MEETPIVTGGAGFIGSNQAIADRQTIQRVVTAHRPIAILNVRRDSDCDFITCRPMDSTAPLVRTGSSALMMLNAFDGRRLPIYGDGRNAGDWRHVEDHCSGIWAVLQHGRPGEHYDIGASNEQPNLAIVDRICEMLEELRPARVAQVRGIQQQPGRACLEQA